MIYYSIAENGFITKLTGKTIDDINESFDNTYIFEDGETILVSEKIAKLIVKSIQVLSKN